MAEADFTAFTAATNNGLDSADISKGVTLAAGFVGPTGGGSFIAALHALTASTGFAGWYYSADAAYNPIATSKGGVITAAMRRHAASTAYAPMIGFISGIDLATANAYVLGLSNNDPYQFVLRKGLVIGGLDSGGSDVLRVSTSSFSSNTAWHHLKLEVVVNPHGDVVVNVYMNLGNVTTPVWVVIPGMDSFVDDSNGIFTGTPPLISGFCGFFGHYNSGAAGKVSLFDQITIERPNSP